MRKLFILYLFVQAGTVYANGSFSQYNGCWRTVLEGIGNEITFCFNNYLFNSITLHPNIGTGDPPTTCMQIGLVELQEKDDSALINLDNGVCANGMRSPAATLNCSTAPSDLVCLHDGENTIMLRPAHIRPIDNDAAR